jgi:hypothetical protein
MISADKSGLLEGKKQIIKDKAK